MNAISSVLASFAAAAGPVFGFVLHASMMGSAVLVLTLLLRRMMRTALSPAVRCLLWLPAVLLLLAPRLPDTGLGWVKAMERPSVLSRKVTEEPGRGVVVRTGTPTFLHTTNPTSVTSKVGLTLSATSTVIWCIGSASVMSFWLFSYLMLKLRVRQSSGRVPRSLAAKAELWAKTMGLRKMPRLRVTHAVKTPAVMGMFRAEILLPPTFEDTLNPDELRMVMLHEMGHVKRHDLLFHWLSLLILALHWFNPLCWLAAWLYRADREAACDAAVLRACRHDSRSMYGHTLLKLETNAASGPCLPSLVGVLGSAEMLRSRIIEIARFGRGSRWAGRCSMIAVAAFAMSLAVMAAEPPAPKPVVTATDDKTGDSEMLTRIYKVPPDFLKLSSATPTVNPDAAKELFADRGIAFPEGAGATFVIATSQLVIKNTAANLREIERIVDSLLMSLQKKRRQVYISMNMVVFDKSMLGKDIGIVPGKDNTLQKASASSAPLSLAGVLTDPQYQVVLRALAQHQKGASDTGTKVEAILSLPGVTTRSEEKATVEVVREYRYATEYEPAVGGADAKPRTFASRDVGFKMEVEPVISEDATTLDISLKPTVSTYLETKQFGKGVEQPVFDTTTLSTALTIREGETIELAGEVPLSNFLLDPDAKKIAPPPSPKYPVLLFVTARVIDPTGQPVNKPAAKPAAQSPKKAPLEAPVSKEPMPPAKGVELSAVYGDVTAKTGENPMLDMLGVVFPNSSGAPTTKPVQEEKSAVRSVDLQRTAQLGILGLSGVFTETQTQEVIKALRQRSGVAMRTFDAQKLPVGETKMVLDLGGPAKGRKVVVEPVVGPDGYTVDLCIALPSAISDKGDITTAVTIWDGQTVVLGGLLSEKDGESRHGMLFITAKILREPMTESKRAGK